MKSRHFSELIVILISLTFSNAIKGDAKIALELPPTPSQTSAFKLLGDINCHTQGVTLTQHYVFTSCIQLFPIKALLLRYPIPPHFPSAETPFQKPEIIDLSFDTMLHPSGLDHDESCVWNASAHYRPFFATSKISCIDPNSLKILNSFEVNDHIGTLAVMGDKLVLMNWGSEKIYLFSKRGKKLSEHKNPSGKAYQDCRGKDASNIICMANIQKSNIHYASLDHLNFNPQSQSFNLIQNITLHEENIELGREGFSSTKTHYLFLPNDYPNPTLFLTPKSDKALDASLTP